MWEAETGDAFSLVGKVFDCCWGEHQFSKVSWPTHAKFISFKRPQAELVALGTGDCWVILFPIEYLAFEKSIKLPAEPIITDTNPGRSYARISPRAHLFLCPWVCIKGILIVQVWMVGNAVEVGELKSHHNRHMEPTARKCASEIWHMKSSLVHISESS